MSGDETGTVADGAGSRASILQRPERRRVVDATAEDVWRVLADGWQYATWVVGAARVRAVDASWPEPGSRIHHSVGLWPLLLSDVTEVEDSVPGRLLLLRAQGQPLGEARVLIELVPHGDRCVVSIREDAAGGPGRLVPTPVRQALILPRNAEALQRLALLAERREGDPGSEADG